ncbi:MAG: hypothetical protein ACOCY7_01500, partial [Halodesulfurarchaeum sp.]
MGAQSSDMEIGVPRERKTAETRVGMTPEDVTQLVTAGHDVLVEAGAGENSDLSDDAYREAGAAIVDRERDGVALAYWHDG